MVSTLIILLVSGLSLFLVWNIFRPGLPQIKSLEDWEAKKHEADVQVFRILLDPMEEKYLQRSLPPREFRVFQRRRIALALGWLDLIAKNAGMLMKLGQLARNSTNPTLAREAEDLIHGALRLRVNLLTVQLGLWLKWVFPGWALSLPAIETPYEELLAYLSRIQRQQLWDNQQVLTAG